MRCAFYKPHEHPPKEVTYSKDNPQASLYHCPDIDCGNKKKSITRAPTPQYEWVTTSVKEAEAYQFEPCPMCFSQDAGASDEKAREAAEEIAGFENRQAAIEADMKLLKWMLGGNLAFSLAILVILLRPLAA